MFILIHYVISNAEGGRCGLGEATAGAVAYGGAARPCHLATEAVQLAHGFHRSAPVQQLVVQHDMRPCVVERELFQNLGATSRTPRSRHLVNKFRKRHHHAVAVRSESANNRSGQTGSRHAVD